MDHVQAFQSAERAEGAPHMNDTFVCDVCGASVSLDRRTVFDGQELCILCLEIETVVCDWCGRRIWHTDNAGDDGTPLCQDCRDDYYTDCCECGRLIRNEDACYRRNDEEGEHPYCYHCFQNVGVGGINSYHYKPEPIFYGRSARFFGVELEIDGGGEYDSRADRILEIANKDEVERVYCKHDGSLNDGFEIVTHPMTLVYHKTEMPWKDILTEAVHMGYLSHRAGTCGLHVHVNRNSFGDTEREQDACIARILYFFEKHWEELLKFSRRTQHQLDQWAARYGYKEHPMEILDHAKKGYGRGRYTSVNLQNEDTIEFRIFRGTLKYNTLIATLQLVERICSVATVLSDEELKAMSWTTFVVGCTDQELVQYLKERRLYVNEEVESEVEL